MIIDMSFIFFFVVKALIVLFGFLVWAVICGGISIWLYEEVGDYYIPMFLTWLLIIITWLIVPTLMVLDYLNIFNIIIQV